MNPYDEGKTRGGLCLRRGCYGRYIEKHCRQSHGRRQRLKARHCEEMLIQRWRKGACAWFSTR